MPHGHQMLQNVHSCPASPCVRIPVGLCLTKCGLPFHVQIYVEQQ